MTRIAVLSLYFIAAFLLSGAYGLTFMLPKLFANFGADEKYVGAMLVVTTVATVLAVYYSGHLSDLLGRINTLGAGGCFIALSLFLFGWIDGKGILLILASATLGVGWGLVYSLTPIVLTRMTTPDQRVRYFSLLSVFLMAGFGLSPVMTAEMENAGFSVADAFFLMSALCLAGGLIYFFLVPPIRRLSANAGDESRSSITLSSLGVILKSQAMLPITMVFLGASVFAGMTNFQTVFASAEGLNYSNYFLAYTITVVVCRILLVGFKGGKSPYATIAGLQYVMAASVVLFIFVDGSETLYILVGILFGIGYGASYPILTAMAANDANDSVMPQTMQLFALTYFVGIFGFPLVAGWVITEVSITALLVGVTLLALIEASMAFYRYLNKKGQIQIPVDQQA